MRRFLASALAVALTLLVAEGLMVYISALPDTTCGLTTAATPSTLVDTFVRADQTGWGISHSTGSIGACAWGGDADGTSATATRSDGAAHAGGDALVKVMASATDSGETYNFAAKPQTFYWIRLHVSGTSVKTVSAHLAGRRARAIRLGAHSH